MEAGDQAVFHYMYLKTSHLIRNLFSFRNDARM